MTGYAVRWQQVAVAGGDDLQVRSLLDRQQYFDPLGEAEAAWYLGGLLAAIRPDLAIRAKLADLMQGWNLGSRRVLEIGCGLGLASLVVHRRLGDITASDCHPLAETFLQANLLLNHLPELKYQTGNWGHENPALGEFDLIIGSDILYERNHPAQLAEFILLHAARQAEVLIIDPNRSNRSAFNRSMALAGFVLNEKILEAPLHDGSPYRGRLLHFCRNQPPSH